MNDMKCHHALSYAITKRLPLLAIFTALLFGMVQEGYGQRVYANSQQPSPTQSALLVILSTVDNPSRSTDANLDNYSTIRVGVGALNLFSATQNLQFTEGSSVGLLPSSPIFVKTMVNGSTLGLLDAVTLQRTNGGIDQTVGTEYTVTTLLDLLGIIGGTNEELIVVLPVPSQGLVNDGVQLTVSSVLALGLSARLYYAFFITPPQVESTSITICENTEGALSISNFHIENSIPYTYRLYNSEIDGNEVGVTTTTNNLTIPPNLPAGEYWLEAREDDFYPSGRIKITINRTPLPGRANLDIKTSTYY